ncbi:hypothetical protein [Nocardia farcinica]|uniref:hypothetical protein n=1 Tax=Nocardia farcinica TaxID=37329 RepID=UPI003427E0A3
MANYHRTDQRVRCLHALQLRIDGYTWQEICDTTRYWKTEAGARNAVNGLLDKWESETVDQHRVIQDQRYRKLLRAWMPAATGDPDRTGELTTDPDEAAAKVVLKVMDGINKLHGLARVADENTGRMSPEEFAAALAEYAKLAAADPGAPR